MMGIKTREKSGSAVGVLLAFALSELRHGHASFSWNYAMARRRNRNLEKHLKEGSNGGGFDRDCKRRRRFMGEPVLVGNF